MSWMCLPLALHRLTSSVYVSIPPYSIPSDSNKGYIVCEKYVIVVDTTYHFDRIRQDLKELRTITQRDISYVINTHYHPDHCYGNGLFTCPIVAHRDCPKLMKKVRKRQIAEMIREEKSPEVGRDLRKLRLRYPRILFEQSYGFDSTPEVRVIHLGGHSPDLSVVHLPEERIVFSSDNLFGSQNPSTPSHPYITPRSDLDTWIIGLKTILNMEPRVVVPGHFGVCDTRAVSATIQYLEHFIAKIRELKGAGYSRQEITHKPQLLDLPRLGAEEWLTNNIEAQYDRL